MTLLPQPPDFCTYCPVSYRLCSQFSGVGSGRMGRRGEGSMSFKLKFSFSFYLICKHLNLGRVVCAHLLYLIFLWVWWCNFTAFLGGWVRGDGKFKAFLDTETLFWNFKKCASRTKKAWQSDLDPWTNVKVWEETWPHRLVPWLSHVCLGMCTHTYYICTNKYTHW